MTRVVFYECAELTLADFCFRLIYGVAVDGDRLTGLHGRLLGRLVDGHVTCSVAFTLGVKELARNLGIFFSFK